MTILQALKSKVDYPREDCYYEEILIGRGLDKNAEYTDEIARSRAFIGAHADGLFSLLTAVNFSESDISVSLPNMDNVLHVANILYSSIGEPVKNPGIPRVRIGR